jgi:O-antigen/teichoic acid export membrane protein
VYFVWEAIGKQLGLIFRVFSSGKQLGNNWDRFLMYFIWDLIGKQLGSHWDRFFVYFLLGFDWEAIGIAFLFGT